ncbi:MAG: molybdopterin-dependent oxidoreductase [Candidatus Thorarchaeota archaeon]
MKSKSRLPPGQRWITGFPVRTVERMPDPFNPKTWTLTIDGEVKNPVILSYDEFRGLPITTQTSDFHCVEGWSVPDNKWEGVLFKDLAQRVQPKPTAHYVLFHAEHEYTSAIALQVLMEDDVILAWNRNNSPLRVEDGWPLRLVIPQLYAYKSVKWVRRITFLKDIKLGYWEKRGYHQDADPWKNQRFARP